MKKILSLLLALSLIFILVACNGKKDNTSTPDTNTTSQTGTESSETASTGTTESNTTDGSSSTTETTSSTASSEKKDTSSTVSTETTSSQTKPSTPSKLNPKKDFKFGKYAAEFFGEGKKSYSKCSLNFAQDYEGFEYQNTTYYTKEECERLYGDWGFDATDPDSYDREITVGNVKYYNMIGVVAIAEAYEMTDKVIKITADFDNFGTLSLNADGTLVVDIAAGDRYGTVGTVYKFVEE